MYTRKSKFTGTGDSIENQQELCREYIKKQFGDAGHTVLLYEDEGFSGKNTDRPMFRQLLSDAKRGAIDYLVCYRLDRISRSVIDFSSLVELLNEKKIGLICIREQFDTSTPMGRAMMYIASVFAQLERETIAERVNDNMLLLAKDGRWLGGTPPFGYQPVKNIVNGNGKERYYYILMQKEPEFSTVCGIFHLAVTGLTPSDISKYLAANGIFTRNGRPFSPAVVKGILLNPVYAAADELLLRFFKEKGADVRFLPNEANLGVICYHKRTGRLGSEQRCDISEWIAANGVHQAAVSGKEWIEIRKRLFTQSRPKRPHDCCALLAGTLFCGQCGGKMYPKRRSRSSNEFDYICSRKLSRNSSCSCRNLPGNFADSLVANAIFLKPAASKLPKECRETDFPFYSLSFEEKRRILSLLAARIVWDGSVLSIHCGKQCAQLFSSEVSVLDAAHSRRSLQ